MTSYCVLEVFVLILSVELLNWYLSSSLLPSLILYLLFKNCIYHMLALYSHLISYFRWNYFKRKNNLQRVRYWTECHNPLKFFLLTLPCSNFFFLVLWPQKKSSIYKLHLDTKWTFLLYSSCFLTWCLKLIQAVYLQVKHRVGVEEIVNHVLQAWEAATGNRRRWSWCMLPESSFATLKACTS